MTFRTNAKFVIKVFIIGLASSVTVIRNTGLIETTVLYFIAMSCIFTVVITNRHTATIVSVISGKPIIKRRTIHESYNSPSLCFYILIFAINRRTKIINLRTLTIVSVISEKPIIKWHTIYHKVVYRTNK